MSRDKRECAKCREIPTHSHGTWEDPPNGGMGGWGSRNRTSIWRVRQRMLLPAREDLQKPRFNRPHKRLETLEFREPYRMDGVQSFRENRPIRRIICRRGRSGVRSSSEKSLLLLGFNANEFARRRHGLELSGGARGIRTVGAIYLCLSAPRSQLSHYIAANPAGFTLRLSSCRFHNASTNNISG